MDSDGEWTRTAHGAPAADSAFPRASPACARLGIMATGASQGRQEAITLKGGNMATGAPP